MSLSRYLLWYPRTVSGYIPCLRTFEVILSDYFVRGKLLSVVGCSLFAPLRRWQCCLVSLQLSAVIPDSARPHAAVIRLDVVHYDTFMFDCF